MEHYDTFLYIAIMIVYYNISEYIILFHYDALLICYDMLLYII